MTTRLRSLISSPEAPRVALAAALIACWLPTARVLPPGLPTQLASWLVFIGLFITPGYLLGDLITRPLRLDTMERLALAFPAGLALLSVPGLVALSFHLSIDDLVRGWRLVSIIIILSWLGCQVWARLRPVSLLVRGGGAIAERQPWAIDELILLVMLVVGFLAALPSLSLSKIDGDAYAVASFSADALAGLPLNAHEPLFGTNLGPGVRMVFNQSLPMAYLWSRMSRIDPITLAATASRAMPALFAVLAAYALAKAAAGGPNGRRFGLFAAALQMLIYLAAPFFRGDNVSIFFFERVNADKFMVPVAILPVLFAFAIRFVRDGHWRAWWVAAVVCWTASTIHPFMAAMAAAGLAGFAGLHLLLGLRQRRTWISAGAVGGLMGVVMFVPLCELFISRGEAPLVSSFPTSRNIQSWPVGTVLEPVAPFIYLPSLTYYGPLPQLAQIDPAEVHTTMDPFLVWRFAVNMSRRRLILFDVQHYIADPNLVLEPPYLLALLLLPLLLWRIRSDVGAQYAVGCTLVTLLAMFTPFITPMIGALVMPWILWRFVWLLPYALTLAMAARRGWWGVSGLLGAHRGPALLARFRATGAAANNDSVFAIGPRRSPLGGQPRPAQPAGQLAAATIAVLALAASPLIARNLQNLHDRTFFPHYFPTPMTVLKRLQELTASGPAMVLAPQDLSVTIPAYVANASIVAHRMPTTSEVFPADQQEIALQRLTDQDAFFRTPYLTVESLDILRRYDVRYVVAPSGSRLDAQLALAPAWFEPLVTSAEGTYSLYAVRQVPSATAAIRANSAMVARNWTEAEQLYNAALSVEPDNLLALTGLADLLRAQGEFDATVERLHHANAVADVPFLHFRLGQVLVQVGRIQEGIAELDEAQAHAPDVAVFHVSLGDACLAVGDEECASKQYQAAAADASTAKDDTATQAIVEADLWRQRGQTEAALQRYESAVAQRPSQYNRLMLVSAYRDAGQGERAAELATQLREDYPLSPEVLAASADVLTVKGDIEGAVSQYRDSIHLQELLSQDATTTRLALGRALLGAGRGSEALGMIARVLLQQPFNASAYRLLGDLYRAQGEDEAAITAYRQAFDIDPTQTDVYLALRDELRAHGEGQNDLAALLQKALALNPNDAALALDLGDQQLRLNHPAEALEAYRSAVEALDAAEGAGGTQALTAGSGRAFAYARLAELCEDQGEVGPALNFNRAAVAAARDAPWTQVLLGDALRLRGDGDGAKAAYRAALDDDPTFVDAYVRLADMLRSQGDDTRAAALEAELAQVASAHLQGSAPKGFPAKARQGNLLSAMPADPTLQSDETSTALGAAEARATSGAGPLDKEAELLLAEGAVSAVRVAASAEQASGRWDQAVQIYRDQIAAGEAQNADLTLLARYYKGLGDLYLAQGRIDQAEVVFRQAVSLDRWWLESYLGLANALDVKGDPAGSLRQIRIAAQIAPGAVEPQIALAGRLAELGQEDLALEIYRATAKAHPGNPQATLALARALAASGRAQEAGLRYRQILALSPGSSSAYVGLAGIYGQLGRDDEARKLLDKAIAVDHTDVAAYSAMAELAQRSGQREEATQWYQRAADVARPGEPGSLDLVSSMLRYGYYEVSLSYVEAALAQRPDDVELLLDLGRIHRAMGHFSEANEVLARAVPLARDDARIYAALAELDRDQGRDADAIRGFGQAIALQPGEAGYYLALSELLVARGDPRAALDVLDKGRQQASAPDELIVAMHDLMMLQGSAPLALGALEQGLRDRPDDAVLLLAVGAHYQSQGDFQAAARQLESAMVAYPGRAALHVALGSLSQQQSQGDIGLKEYEKAAELEPVNASVALVLARAYEQTGRAADAIRSYERVIALEPAAAEPYVSLAALYQKSGRVNDARLVYARALALMPASPELLAPYAAFLVDAGEGDKALGLIDELVERAPSARNLIVRATTYRSLHRPDDAERDLEAALQVEPGTVNGLLALGDLYKDSEQYAKAQRVYEKVVALAPGSPVGYTSLAKLAALQQDEGKTRLYADRAHKTALGALIRPDDVVPKPREASE